MRTRIDLFMAVFLVCVFVQVRVSVSARLPLERLPRPTAADKKTFHEPAPPSNCSLPRESGAVDARTPDASRLPAVSESREASGVRAMYRRLSSGAGRRAAQRPNARSSDRGGRP